MSAVTQLASTYIVTPSPQHWWTVGEYVQGHRFWEGGGSPRVTKWSTGHGECWGTVIDYDGKWFKIAFDDGDEEDWNTQELVNHLREWKGQMCPVPLKFRHARPGGGTRGIFLVDPFDNNLDLSLSRDLAGGEALSLLRRALSLMLARHFVHAGQARSMSAAMGGIGDIGFPSHAVLTATLTGVFDIAPVGMNAPQPVASELARGASAVPALMLATVAPRPHAGDTPSFRLFVLDSRTGGRMDKRMVLISYADNQWIGPYSSNARPLSVACLESFGMDIVLEAAEIKLP